jgi:hypothetical protein
MRIFACIIVIMLFAAGAARAQMDVPSDTTLSALT